MLSQQQASDGDGETEVMAQEYSEEEQARS
jgi:hypothetical protein